MESNIIIQGDCLEELKKLPEKSINMCMTSPPYWALRDYGDETKSIWDGDENCEHDFDIKERQLHSGTLEVTKTIHHALKVGALKTDWKTKDGFCQKCDAWKGQLGLEPTFDLYIKHLCDIFDGVKRVLRDDGTCWVNIGDTYNAGGNYRGKEIDESCKEVYSRKDFEGCKNDIKAQGIPAKCLTMIPMRFAIEMVNRGWILRNTIIWHKRNCMPSSVKDRFTVDFEYIFFFSKKKKYYFETQYEPFIYNGKSKDLGTRGEQGYSEAHGGGRDTSGGLGRGINKSKGRNKRTVWTINPKPFKESHFAVYPEELCKTPIKAGCPEEGVVLDPFFGAGTTGLVALKQNKKFVGIELNPEYIKIANARLKPYLEQTRLEI